MAAGTRLFVGNIAWGTTEEDLQELFSRVGEARFDLHREKGTSKSSGYGFVDFKDAQAALQALQKFNGYDLNGRELNVDFPSQSTKQTNATGAPPANTKASPFAQAKVRDIQRQAPTKAAPGSTSQKVNNVIDSLTSAEIYDILMSLKEDPEAGRRHLQTNPSLAYALLQAQVVLGYIPGEKAPSYFMGYDEVSTSSAMAVDANTAYNPMMPAHAAPPMAQPPMPQQPSFQPQPQQHMYQPPYQAPAQPQQAAPMSMPPAAKPSSSGPPPLSELVRMPPAQLEKLDLPPQFKTLVTIVHTWSQRPPHEFEALGADQQAKIRRIFEDARVPVPSTRR